MKHRQALIERCVVNNNFLGDVTVFTYVAYNRFKEIFLFCIQLCARDEVTKTPHGLFTVNANEGAYEDGYIQSARHTSCVLQIVILASEFRPQNSLKLSQVFYSKLFQVVNLVQNR